MTRLARVLDSDMREFRRLHPTQQSVDDRVTPLSTASLTLPDGEHAAFGEWVEVFTQSGSSGVYRVVSASETYTGEASAELEHGICALGDAIIPGKGTISGTLSQVLGAMLGHQVVNSGGAPLWALGSVETNAQSSFEHDSTNLLSAVLAVVPDGYMLTFDQSALPWRMGVAKMAATAECEGRLSRNLRGVTVTVDDEDFCTRIYCNMLPSPGYMDGPTVGTWGVKAKTITAQENVTQESLTSYITQYLEDHKNPRVSIECDAEDLSSITGESIDRMEKGRLFRLALPDYGVAMEERILSVHTGSAYDEPERVRLSLANSVRDTADTLVYLDNAVTGGASSSGVRGGYVASGGTGISQASVLDMLKKTETYITEDEAWTREAGIRIESNTAEMYATKTAIVGGWTGDVEKINALIRASTDNGGLVAMLVGRKNTTDEVSAAITATAAGGGLITLKADSSVVTEIGTRVNQTEIAIDNANAAIALKASQKTVDDLGERVTSAEINIDGANAAIALKVSKDGIIGAINLSPEEIVISASRINLSGYVTMSQFSAEIANLQITESSILRTGSLTANNFIQCNGNFYLGDSRIYPQSMDVVVSVSGKATGEIAVRDASGTIIGTALTGYRVSYSTETINYLGY